VACRHPAGGDHRAGPARSCAGRRRHPPPSLATAPRLRARHLEAGRPRTYADHHVAPDGGATAPRCERLGDERAGASARRRACPGAWSPAREARRPAGTAAGSWCAQRRRPRRRMDGARWTARMHDAAVANTSKTWRTACCIASAGSHRIGPAASSTNPTGSRPRRVPCCALARVPPTRRPWSPCSAASLMVPRHPQSNRS